MSKEKSIFICQSCGNSSPRWEGKCPSCGQWNSLVEEITKKTKIGQASKLQSNAQPLDLSAVKSHFGNVNSCGFLEVDRVLGGGFVPGQVVLLAGEPGIGKSTLLLQIASRIRYEKLDVGSGKVDKEIGSGRLEKDNLKSVLYIAGEESPEQIKIRAERLKINGEKIITYQETDVDEIILFLKNNKDNFKLIIVDSIQTLNTTDLTGTSGSIGQVRECAFRLLEAVKFLGIPLILVGHVTKEGAIAGPKVLEHLVDTVLYMEGDTNHEFRIIKTTKNRFGPINEVGVFSMEEGGLKEVSNPSGVFIAERVNNVPGSVTTIIMEGTRPVALEIQALTSKTPFGFPKRASSGFSLNRLNILCAVLTKRAKINLYNEDVFVSVAGGINITEPGADLAVCLAIASSCKNLPVASQCFAVGEVGLLGEIRKVSSLAIRIKEGKRLGFTQGVTWQECKSLQDAISKTIGDK